MNMFLGSRRRPRRTSGMVQFSTVSQAAGLIEDDLEAPTHRNNNSSAWVPVPRSDAEQDRRKLELEYGTSRAMREIFPFYVGQPFERLLMPAWSLTPKWTLSTWLENMDKLDLLIDRLQKLASSATQLLNKVSALRATFKRQQERFIEFLELSEEYAGRYLRHISTHVDQQSTALNNLKERLEAANKLHRKAVDLKTYYEFGTVTAMKNFRAKTGLRRPLPKDELLFNKVKSVMDEIGRFYKELDEFWAEEIKHVVEALGKGCTDPEDLERWNKFHSSLEQTLRSWKRRVDRPPNGDAETLRSNNTPSSTGSDLGAIASSLSFAIGSLSEALQSMSSSASLKHSSSRPGRPLFGQVLLKNLSNKDTCHEFLSHCTNYGKNMQAWRHFCVTLFASRVGAPSDLKERITRLRSEVTDVSTEAASAQGPRPFKTTYNKALTLEQKTTSGLIQGLNTLLENLSWVAITVGPSDDELPVVVTLEQLNKVKRAWEKARDSVHEALEMTNERANSAALV